MITCQFCRVVLKNQIKSTPKGKKGNVCIWTEVEKQHTAYRGDVPKVDKHSEFSLKVQAAIFWV